VVPSNLIHESLVRFTAARGLGPRLAGLSWWTALQLGDPPDQLFSWSPASSPMEVYVAAPLDDVPARSENLTRVLVQRVNPWLATNGVGNFAPAGEGSDASMVWQGLPALSPFVKPARTGSGGVLLAGSIFEPQTPTGSGIPSAMVQELNGHTNLVYYDWEFSGRRIESTVYMGQVIRVALRKPQFPLDSVGATWLRAIMPRLGPSTTLGTASQTGGLSLSRKSTAGLTAGELQWLVDWLESPHFPRGLHSTSFTVEPAN
jgi:hypothetical protein